MNELFCVRMQLIKRDRAFKLFLRHHVYIQIGSFISFLLCRFTLCGCVWMSLCVIISLLYYDKAVEGSVGKVACDDGSGDTISNA